MDRQYTDFQAYKRLPSDIDTILKFATDFDCSDVMIKCGESPYLYRYGLLYRPMNKTTDLDWNTWRQKAITSEQNALYVREKMLDLSYVIDGTYRYRVSAGFSTGVPIATFRMITRDLPNFTKLKLDKKVVDLLTKAFSEKSGITMLVGATGSGKTTTLASCINEFSKRNEGALVDAHMITLEDPIEYIYPSQPRCRIIQKELGVDFKSFTNGVKQSLREHPSHILVGETRDVETIRALTEASRTGHSCITTFHTSTVSDTIARLYSYLAGTNQDIMYDLVSNMNFIMCQRLRKGRTRYTLEYQYMFFTPDIIKVLIDAVSKDLNIPNTMNRLMENSALVKSGVVSDWKTVKV